MVQSAWEAGNKTQPNWHVFALALARFDVWRPHGDVSAANDSPLECSAWLAPIDWLQSSAADDSDSLVPLRLESGFQSCGRKDAIPRRNKKITDGGRRTKATGSLSGHNRANRIHITRVHLVPFRLPSGNHDVRPGRGGEKYVYLGPGNPKYIMYSLFIARFNCKPCQMAEPVR
jgi:hypothetical protein